MDTRVHISLEVSDLKKSADFYAKLFQHEPTKVLSDYANFRLETPQLHLALVSKPDRAPEKGPSHGSNRHYGIELFSDDRLNAWLGKAQQSGLAVRIEEDVTCCYATANKFWAQDPDGHEWEFWVRTAEADSMHGKKEEMTKKAGCCAAGASC